MTDSSFSISPLLAYPVESISKTHLSFICFLYSTQLRSRLPSSLPLSIISWFPGFHSCPPNHRGLYNSDDNHSPVQKLPGFAIPPEIVSLDTAFSVGSHCLLSLQRCATVFHILLFLLKSQLYVIFAPLKEMWYCPPHCFLDFLYIVFQPTCTYV